MPCLDHDHPCAHHRPERHGLRVRGLGPGPVSEVAAGRGHGGGRDPASGPAAQQQQGPQEVGTGVQRGDRGGRRRGGLQGAALKEPKKKIKLII